MSLTGSPTFWFCIEWGHKVYSQLWAKYIFSIALPPQITGKLAEKVSRNVFHIEVCLWNAPLFGKEGASLHPDKPEKLKERGGSLWGPHFQKLGKALFLPQTSSFHLLLLHHPLFHQSWSPLLFRASLCSTEMRGCCSLLLAFLNNSSCLTHMSTWLYFYSLWPKTCKSHQVVVNTKCFPCFDCSTCSQSGGPFRS